MKMIRRSINEELVNVIEHVIFCLGEIKEVQEKSDRGFVEGKGWVPFKYKWCTFNSDINDIRISFEQYNFAVTIRPERIIIKSRTKKYDISHCQLLNIQQQLKKIKQL